jgi:hypothetical protein
MPTAPPPPTASRYHAVSALAATAAARAALRVRPQGVSAIWQTIARFQVAQAVLAPRAVDRMLAEQDITVQAVSTLNPAAFTVDQAALDRMLADINADMEREFQRLVASLVQDSGRAAESVAIVARPGVGHVRHLTLPSCSRCAVLAGRIYRHSEGFERHPGCDCVMIPVTVASPDLTYDLDDLVARGQVTSLSKADRQAVADGADLAQVVNVRRASAGLRESGRALSRRGRMTPEAIYRQTGDDRDAAIALLVANGYLR